MLRCSKLLIAVAVLGLTAPLFAQAPEAKGETAVPAAAAPVKVENVAKKPAKKAAKKAVKKAVKAEEAPKAPAADAPQAH
ncbi:MAG: hypothetical protein A2V88_09455 [Elusimicrobia bacterium RBG_16_66_12]|nr:MAG: hypothetical protein A2V88_09455 [Elusimicrobia bacterium RBG_16_66_12]